MKILTGTCRELLENFVDVISSCFRWISQSKRLTAKLGRGENSGLDAVAAALFTADVDQYSASGSLHLRSLQVQTCNLPFIRLLISCPI